MPNLDALTSELRSFIATSGDHRTAFDLPKNRVIFGQGEAADSIYYLRRGLVKVTALSGEGKTAVVSVLHAGVFFGEDCLSDRSRRRASAISMVDCSITRIVGTTFARLLQDETTLSKLFIAHLLERNLQIEDDRVDQIFNCSEKRLARALVLLTNARAVSCPPAALKVSQETLSEMVGTTRSRVSFFMNKFKKLGYISYESGLEVHPGLLAYLRVEPQA